METIINGNGNWYIDIGLDIKSELNQCLQWRTSAHSHIVKEVLGIDGRTAARITSMGSSKYSRDLSSHLTAVSGCRIEPGSRGEGCFHAVYLQIYTTDKTVTYHPEGHHHAKAMTIKEAMGKEQPVPFLQKLYETYKDASDTISSNARIEVRVPFQHATEVLLNIRGDILRGALVSFETKDWWYVRFVTLEYRISEKIQDFSSISVISNWKTAAYTSHWSTTSAR
jgi:hypothetical protein